MSSEHAALLKVIDNIDNFRPENSKGDGCCFGTTITVVSEVFNGTLDKYVQTVKAVNQAFAGLSTEADIKQRIQEWENDSEKSQHLTRVKNIATAQDPLHHLGECLAQSGAAHMQHGSIPLLLTTFSGAAAKSNSSVNPMACSGFTVSCDYTKLKSFFMEISLKNANLPMAFVISMLGHTIGCGYDHIRKSWFFTDTRWNSHIKQDMSIVDIIANVWTSIKKDHNGPRAIFIQPILPFSNEVTDCDRVIFSFKAHELKQIAHYSKEAILEMYITAYNFQDKPTLDVMIHDFLINPLFKFHNNVRILSSRDDLLMYSLENDLDDVALGCIWHEEYPEFNKQNTRGETPLILAIKKGKIYFAERITNINKINIYLEDNDGKTAYTHAVENKDTTLIDRLNALSYVAKRVRPADHCCTWTELHYAAERGQLDRVKLLIENNADVNAESFQGYTPLHLAAINGHANVIEALCTHLNMDIASDYANLVNALECTGQFKHNIAASILVQRYARHYMSTHPGLAPSQIAAFNGHLKMLTLLKLYQSTLNKPPLPQTEVQERLIMFSANRKLSVEIPASSSNIHDLTNFQNKVSS